MSDKADEEYHKQMMREPEHLKIRASETQYTGSSNHCIEQDVV